jgi:hypothetical protein
MSGGQRGSPCLDHSHAAHGMDARVRPGARLLLEAGSHRRADRFRRRERRTIRVRWRRLHRLGRLDWLRRSGDARFWGLDRRGRVERRTRRQRDGRIGRSRRRQRDRRRVVSRELHGRAHEELLDRGGLRPCAPLRLLWEHHRGHSKRDRGVFRRRSTGLRVLRSRVSPPWLRPRRQGRGRPDADRLGASVRRPVPERSLHERRHDGADLRLPGGWSLRPNLLGSVQLLRSGRHAAAVLPVHDERRGPGLVELRRLDGVRLGQLRAQRQHVRSAAADDLRAVRHVGSAASLRLCRFRLARRVGLQLDRERRLRRRLRRSKMPGRRDLRAAWTLPRNLHARRWPSDHDADLRRGARRVRREPAVVRNLHRVGVRLLDSRHVPRRRAADVRMHLAGCVIRIGCSYLFLRPRRMNAAKATARSA